jgi:hypothetical protein
LVLLPGNSILARAIVTSPALFHNGEPFAAAASLWFEEGRIYKD